MWQSVATLPLTAHSDVNLDTSYPMVVLLSAIHGSFLAVPLVVGKERRLE